MTEIGDIHWSEGLFLQPHHLQTMQRRATMRSAEDRRLLCHYPYGLVESQLSNDALENRLVQFDRLRVVMPSGLEVSVPENADLPALDIKEAFESGHTFTVHIGVPLWYAERANTVSTSGDEDWRAKRIYRVSEIERTDENTGANPQPIMVRRINARLLLDDDDTSDLETLPLLRIAHGTSDEIGRPRQDASFIPPCMVLNACAALRELVRDLVNQLEASRKELVLQISRANVRIEEMRGVQFEQILRLRTLNRFSSRLPQLTAASAVTPFEIYLELRELLAELAALYPGRDQFESSRYDHDQPALAFSELTGKIRGLLRGAVAPNFMHLPLKPEGEVHQAALTDEHLSQPNEYFLGIRTREDPRTLAMLVEDPDQFKLMAGSLANRAIWGIKLAMERVPPLELPSEGGLTYFRLLRGESARMWERIAEDRIIAARWPGMANSDFKLTLYMTVPGGQEET